MISGIIDMLLLVVICFALLWAGWAVWKWWRPAAATTVAGKTIEEIVDKTQDWSALAALRAIRWMDEVEGNPVALAAWEVLYRSIGGVPSAKIATVTSPPRPTNFPILPVRPTQPDNAREVAFVPKGMP